MLLAFSAVIFSMTRFALRLWWRTVSQPRGVFFSIVSSIYDPLGFVARLILPTKTVLHHLCWKGLGWDDRISPAALTFWQDWLKELPKLENFAMERSLSPKTLAMLYPSNYTTSQIHCKKVTVPFRTFDWKRVGPLCFFDGEVEADAPKVGNYPSSRAFCYRGCY